jgi:hypothetical protein
MLIERYAHGFRIVTQFGFQQSHVDERVNFRFGYLYNQTVQPLPSAFPMLAHSFSGSGANCRRSRPQHFSIFAHRLLPLFSNFASLREKQIHSQRDSWGGRNYALHPGVRGMLVGPDPVFGRARIEAGFD